MNSHSNPEKESWEKVASMLGSEKIALSYHWSFNIRNDPKRLAFVLSRYKFAAKMACRNKNVLELGCSEGIGAPILAEFASSYTGVDNDKPAIDAAKRNWMDEKFHFIESDFFAPPFGVFDSLICLDVVEHVYPEHEETFWKMIGGNLSEEGICIIGTPNITSSAYASKASMEGHVNLFSAERLSETMDKIFYNHFMFGMNDEIVHTGFHPMCHYLLCIGCNKRNQ